MFQELFPLSRSVANRPTLVAAAFGERGAVSVGIVLLGCLSLALATQSLLTGVTGLIPLNDRDRAALVEILGGVVILSPDVAQPPEIELSLTPLLLIAAGVCVLAFGGSIALLRLRRQSLPSETAFGVAGPWIWWLLPGGAEVLQLLAFAAGLNSVAALLYSFSSLVLLVSLAGWLSGLLILRGGPSATTTDAGSSPTGSRLPESWPVLLGIGVFVAVFFTLNVQLYRGLLLPHGDSAMYEEHLWNLLHGKGFRSYLDQGLFLGEHIQVVHALLIPVYAIFPSHLTLEFCETLALAVAALPIYWLTRRATGSGWCASLLALSWLLYPPLQFLDIAIDLKTFRPISFGVPALLFAFDQYERRRYRTMLVLFVVALLAKEDYALILGPFGLWLVWDALCQQRQAQCDPENKGPHPTSKLRTILPGASLSVFAVAWLLLSTRVLIPWFREGAELHYVAYFSRFGESPGEIIVNMLTKPGLLWPALATAGTASYVLTLLLPLALLPLLGFSRFLVGVPILGLLCLNELIQGDPMPWHHFHAPLLPALFWAAAGGLGTLSRSKLDRLPVRFQDALNAGHLKFAAAAFSASLVAGTVVGIGPLSVQFWSPNSFYAWQKLYVPGPRAELFPQVLAMIPPDSRVASTDFVHPRFTHHERSYDYSNYPRRVANYEDRVPDDTDFIVIDTQHYYSEIKSLDQVRELRTEPDQWDVLDTGTDGYFLVLKRHAVPD
jgi:uncharacterized membrane protein